MQTDVGEVLWVVSVPGFNDRLCLFRKWVSLQTAIQLRADCRAVLETSLHQDRAQKAVSY